MEFPKTPKYAHCPIAVTNKQVAANHSGIVAIGRAIGVFKNRNIAATPIPVKAHKVVASRVVIRKAADPKITKITMRNEMPISGAARINAVGAGKGRTKLLNFPN